MSILVCSDIHGDEIAFDSIDDVASGINRAHHKENSDIDKITAIIVAGDASGYGKNVRAVIKKLMQRELEGEPEIVTPSQQLSSRIYQEMSSDGVDMTNSVEFAKRYFELQQQLTTPLLHQDYLDNLVIEEGGPYQAPFAFIPGNHDEYTIFAIKGGDLEEKHISKRARRSIEGTINESFEGYMEETMEHGKRVRRVRKDVLDLMKSYADARKQGKEATKQWRTETYKKIDSIVNEKYKKPSTSSSMMAISGGSDNLVAKSAMDKKIYEEAERLKESVEVFGWLMDKVENGPKYISLALPGFGVYTGHAIPGFPESKEYVGWEPNEPGKSSRYVPPEEVIANFPGTEKVLVHGHRHKPYETDREAPDIWTPNPFDGLDGTVLVNLGSVSDARKKNDRDELIHKSDAVIIYAGLRSIRYSLRALSIRPYFTNSRRRGAS